MINLEDWKLITKGIYRYVIGANASYEIHILHHANDTDILTANANLYIVGDWKNHKTKENYFERELLLNNTVQECLEEAGRDYKKMW